MAPQVVRSPVAIAAGNYGAIQNNAVKGAMNDSFEDEYEHEGQDSVAQSVFCGVKATARVAFILGMIITVFMETMGYLSYEYYEVCWNCKHKLLPNRGSSFIESGSTTEAAAGDKAAEGKNECGCCSTITCGMCPCGILPCAKPADGTGSDKAAEGSNPGSQKAAPEGAQ